MQLEQYLEHFPREQIHVITSEALRHDRAAAVRDVYEFLGVDPTLSPPALETEFYKTAQRRSYPPLVWKTRRFVKRHVPQAKRAKELVDSMMARRSGGPATASQGVPAADTVISPELRAQLVDLLRDDVARLRAYMSPSFDGWGLA
jgi:hypothetical protein